MGNASNLIIAIASMITALTSLAGFLWQARRVSRSEREQAATITAERLLHEHPDELEHLLHDLAEQQERNVHNHHHLHDRPELPGGSTGEGT